MIAGFKLNTMNSQSLERDSFITSNCRRVRVGFMQYSFMYCKFLIVFWQSELLRNYSQLTDPFQVPVRVKRLHSSHVEELFHPAFAIGVNLPYINKEDMLL